MTMPLSEFMISVMTAEHARSISAWNYPVPYDIYGWMPWDQMEALGIEFGDPLIREEQYVSVLNAQGELCGFAQFFPLVGVTRLGISLCPDLCGNGLGVSFVQSIVREAIRRKPEDEIDLEVLTWNKRAIRVYHKAGFEITDDYERLTPDGLQPFHCMVYQLSVDRYDK
ncbi:GNAT family N-acetyltransferase [Paenibacillus crassostreae]|uniref:Acetyltransferase n=1 Tax=Paenibacillus crassostreae TaxID=1763538 RepID=A0A167D4B6_9BACL|nr:GNAT family N-acetyltransferase [Paenibacillus crassostreae]AOZ92769.1 GNAT family N-acetyltransferase [Paenibacillus crassostreae]OAB73918.1 acetyltransferase [Paenibacillus crassostreae]